MADETQDRTKEQETPVVSPPPPAPGAQQTGQSGPAAAPTYEQRYVPAERFEAVVARKFDAIRQAEESRARALDLERQVRELQARAPQPPQAPQMPAWQAPQAPQITQADIDRLSSQKAAALDFNRRCNESVFAGRKAYNDFDSKIQALKGVAPGLDANGQPMLPQHFVEAALATKRAEHVLYALASDLGEADRIMTLTPMEQAVELTKLADRVAPENSPDVVAQAEKVAASARAGNPIRPVVGAGRAPVTSELALDDPNMPLDEWMRKRSETAWDAKFNGRARR